MGFERFVLIVVMLIGAVLIAGATDLPAAVLEPVGPAAFPLSVGVLLIALALAAVLLGLRGRKAGGTTPPSAVSADQGDPPAATYRPRYDLTLLFVVLTFVYGIVLTFEWLSFQVATVAYLLIAFVGVARQPLRSLPPAIVLALLIGVGVKYLFTHFFYIDLPG